MDATEEGTEGKQQYVRKALLRKALQRLLT